MFAETCSEESLGPYLYLLTGELNIISVFDELRYDRSDADMLSPAMRFHVVNKLKTLGFKQSSGNVLEHPDDVRCILPKSHALGASPFHITSFTKKREQDFYVLTPTQTACQLIKQFEFEIAVEKVKALIQEQPINLFRLSDYLEYCEEHVYFLEAIGHLRYVQRCAVESLPLKKRRALSITKG